MLEGLPPNNAAFVARLTCDEMTARRVADCIVETFDPAETAAAAFEGATVGANGRLDWLVEVFFGTAPDESSVRALVADHAGATAAAGLTFARLAQRDWVAAALDGLKPVRAGRFTVHGAHDRGRVGACEIGIEIEAALAFGTGHHGTTRGCLLALDALLKQRRPAHVLDVGTGTGVLAIAAARALHRRVASGDIDPVSVVAARGNARLNKAGAFVHPVVASGLRHPALAGRYDLILANILAKPLRRLAPAIAAAAAPGATLILSGLLARDVPGVLACYRASGFALTRRKMLDGWATIELKRGGSAARPLI